MKINQLDHYDDIEFDDFSRLAHRRKKPRNKKGNGRSHAVPQEIKEMDDGIESWVPSYAKALDPKHHERAWVIDSLGPFYRDNIITDVTRIVKGGKEANVYACTAHPASGLEMMAAKLYRPRMLRHLKNDAVYKQGRMLRDAEGKQIRSRRERVAIQKKTSFGQKMDFVQWIGTEYRTMTLLYEAGAHVPKPIAFQGNTILMDYIGDAYGPAPTLSEVTLPETEVKPLFDCVLENIRLMLIHELIHGDLSAYNILYWNGRIHIIDFPQMVQARSNPDAQELLERDITRVCDYFTRLGATADPVSLTQELWQAYMDGVL